MIQKNIEHLNENFILEKDVKDFVVLKRQKVSIFKTFQPLFGIIKVSKKAVFFYDDTRNRKSKKANADCMY